MQFSTLYQRICKKTNLILGFPTSIRSFQLHWKLKYIKENENNVFDYNWNVTDIDFFTFTLQKKPVTSNQSQTKFFFFNFQIKKRNGFPLRFPSQLRNIEKILLQFCRQAALESIRPNLLQDRIRELQTKAKTGEMTLKVNLSCVLLINKIF